MQKYGRTILLPLAAVLEHQKAQRVQNVRPHRIRQRALREDQRIDSYGYALIFTEIRLKKLDFRL